MAGELTPEKSFDTLKQNVIEAITAQFPFEGRTQKLVLNKIWADDKLNIYDLKSQAQAKNEGTTWGIPVKADVSLVDVATNKVVDRKTLTISKLPKLTPRYGYIVDGNEYQVDHLFRLKSGIYARIQENGDLESEFNLAKSPSGNFSIELNPSKKIFSIKKGSAHIALYPILKVMGVADDDLEKVWGPEILNANRVTPNKELDALNKFFNKMAPEGTAKPSQEHIASFVGQFFDQTALRPDSTKFTVGQEFSKVTGQALKLAADKILNISRGIAHPDDRDSLVFKEVVSAEDFLPEKIQRSVRQIKTKIRPNLDRKQSIREILSPELFRKPIMDFFKKSGSLTERSDQTNPIEMLGGHRKTTLMAPDLGGIKKEHALTEEMRVINPSHFGFLDPIHTPEGERTGISLHLGLGVRKNGKDLETPVYNQETKKTEYLKVPEFHSAMAVLPDQVKWEGGKPRPIADNVKVKLPGGDIETRPFKDAKYIMPSAKGLFDATTNLIPFLPTNQGNRASMADKQMEQAISLKHREAPLVQVKPDAAKSDDHTFERILGSFTATLAPEAGKISSITPDSIIIQGAGKKKHEVHLYDHFPLNDPKGMMHSTPLVQVGDTVKRGQVLADSNYTRNGRLSLGTNLRVGYMPYKGYNFEDGVVISESAAKKLTSEHLHKKDIEIDPDNDHISKDKFLTFASRKASDLTKEQRDALGEDGIVKPGTRVTKGSILVAAVGKNVVTKSSSELARLGKRAIPPYKDKSLVWDEDHPGTVVRVLKDPTGKGVKVLVKTEEQMEVGDKLSNRYGGKGIVTRILPDHEMPYTTTDKGEIRPLEVLTNISAVPTRINLGQVLEVAAAKIAEKTGKTYATENFIGPEHDYRAEIEKDLDKHNLSDLEAVYDPETKKPLLGQVLVGPQYIIKLKHQVEKKLSVRGGGTDLAGRGLPYDPDKIPVKGGERSGQGFGQLDVYALLGHNARHNLREMSTFKSDQQPIDFWTAIQEGHEPPPPKPTFVYKKFVSLLNGLGVNVDKKGTMLQLVPLTDKKVLEMAGGARGEIKNAHLALRSKDLREEKHGLFDPYVTGGLEGTKWGFIRMTEPLPNPVFVGSNKNRPGPIPTLLNLQLADIDKIIAGEKDLNGKIGGAAIEEALKKIDVQKEIQETRRALPDLHGGELDRANKRLKFLMALKENNLRPNEAYMLHVLPVIPPIFRPVTSTPRGDLHYNSLNGLYKNFAILNKKLSEFDPSVFTTAHANPIRSQLYDGLKALQSVGGAVGYDTDSPGSKRKLKGILDIIGGGEGEQPKAALFISRLIKHRQDLSIRSTITPEPKLQLDEVGLPRKAAMELYKPFVVAELGKLGFDPLSAQEEMRKGSQVAYDVLEKRVMADRPLLLKRDPVLHKFSILAFRPKLVEGKAIQIHPLVTGAFNADFDGDTMAGTVPVSREAIEEARKMIPSKNLFSAASGKIMYVPSQEAMLGLHLLSKWGQDSGKSYTSPLDLEKDINAGKINPNDVVRVKALGSKPTTYGRILIDANLPRTFVGRSDLLFNPKYEIEKKTLGKMAGDLAKHHEREFPEVINDLKDLGNAFSFKSGFSFGVKDLTPVSGRDEILKAADKQADQAKSSIKDKLQLEDRLVDIYQDATNKIDDLLEHKLKNTSNRLATMVYSGARGKKEQLRQMVAAPMLMQDATNRVIPTPVKKSYAEGLDIGDYWLTQHGARKGTLQRALGTSEPGTISKDILETATTYLITDKDCGTKQGIHLPINHEDIYDRVLAKPYQVKGGTIPSRTVVTPEVISRIKESGEDKILVRSPLKCQKGDGICQHCAGLGESGRFYDVGTNIGALAGQALGEPASQMSMDAFHAGGVAAGRGASSVDRITRLKQLLAMPKKLKDSATLARVSGPISAIKKDAAGGVDIYIGKEKHYVRRPLVNDNLKVGDKVEKGEPVSKGLINPLQLLPLTNIHRVQSFLTDELYNGLYKNEGVRRRNVETVVRTLTNLTKVHDPAQSHWLPGDVAALSEVEEFNRNLPAGRKPIEHTPVLKGIVQIPLQSDDWLHRLNYRELHQTIMSGASTGMKSDIHGSHPIPSIAYGAEVGKPPEDVKKKKPYAY